MASVEFLGSVGFKTHRPHARTPRMRMDLRSALSWRDEVEAALEKLIGVVRPAPKPSTERPSRRPVTGFTGRSGANARSGKHPVKPDRSRRKAPLNLSAGPSGCRGEAQTSMNSESSLSSAALGRAPTMERTTSPFW